ncbi:MAG: glutamine--fructose-6-phosphate transaminase (isomerizing) [bacterium]|nr:glutamine--fructose-6-phosphate transaminase (isomerizing) [bacterium]MDZ4248328.1 glutamine--fructose-6-phosphate transaminase (isomerizing) [Patescibacteria group bacterium]
MCGIAGYVGSGLAQPVLLGGLKRLEYRGYDSAGVAELTGMELAVTKAVGRISELEKRLTESGATIGIAHTRWATHGVPSEPNAHPHVAGKLALVHNGIIENYRSIRDVLARRGVTFTSDTDTEVLAQLVNTEVDRKKREGVDRPLAEGVRAALREVRGTFGIVVLSADYPGMLVAARRGSPLVIGYGDGEHLVASDTSALLGRTRRVVYLEDDEMAEITADDVRLETLDAQPVKRKATKISGKLDDVQKQGYAHFMLKEIYEQPEVLHDAIRGRLRPDTGTAKLGGVNLTDDELRDIDQVVLIGCGTALYAGQVAAYWLEKLARVPATAVVASEWRYRNPIVSERTLCVALSQSGETADTLAAIREAKAKGARTIGVINVIGSTIAREVADGGTYIHAGPEIGVASSKAFTNMLGVLLLLALQIGRVRNLSEAAGAAIAKAAAELPEIMASQLKHRDEVAAAAKRYHGTRDALYLGRGLTYPMALEGALKLKEISYVHAEAYPAGEMKHGPIALVDPKLLAVVLAPQNALYEKTKSNLEEIRAREGSVLTVTTEGNRDLDGLADAVLEVPKVHEVLEPFVLAIPLQLFAYEMAVTRGTDVDMPRNLAKSVTVE